MTDEPVTSLEDGSPDRAMSIETFPDGAEDFLRALRHSKYGSDPTSRNALSDRRRVSTQYSQSNWAEKTWE